MTRIIENVVYQHAENACALWWQWKLAVREPHYDYKDLYILENRIKANLDGLLIAGDAAWPFVQELRDADDEGAVFVAAIQALRKGDISTFMSLLDACENQKQSVDELCAALVWVDERFVQGVLAELLASSKAVYQLLGLSAGLAHQYDISNHLETGLTHEDTRVRTITLQAVADRPETYPLSNLAVHTDLEPAECYQLARALVRQGQYEKGHDILESLALTNTPISAEATRLFLLSAEPARSHSFLKKLGTLENRQRDIVRGFGLLGDPQSIGWLIQQCNHAPLARLAGESISMITGVKLAEMSLELTEPPELMEPVLNDDPNDDCVKLDEDENLSWPDIARLTSWWNSSNRKLDSGVAHVCGYLRTPESLQQVLHRGLQRQRTLAADLMMLRQADSRYCDTCLPTPRQAYFMTGIDT